MRTGRKEEELERKRERERKKERVVVNFVMIFSANTFLLVVYI